MRKRATCLGAALAAMLAASATCWALELGEKAPELEVTGWAQGAPIKIADGAGKSVFVVEFVSTFKPECAPAIEGASKLQDKYRAKGLEVVLVSTESVDEVKAYLEAHKTSGRFAVDEDHNTVAAYGSDKESLPYAVVVDKSGSVVYAGDPDEDMQKRVDDVIADRFNLARAVEVGKLTDELHEAWRSREWDKADGLCDKILTLDPGDGYAFRRRCDGFERREDLDGFRKFVKAHVEKVKDDSKTLSAIAWKLITLDRWNWRDPETAVTAARRSVDLSKSADADTLDTYAYVLAELGLLDQAIEQEKKAVALEAANEGLKRRLEFFQACLAERQKVQPSPPPKKK